VISNAYHGDLLAWKGEGRFLFHHLTKLLKLRSLFDELENPSAQNSLTVMAADTH
jgi:hypothetical protein